MNFWTKTKHIFNVHYPKDLYLNKLSTMSIQYRQLFLLNYVSKLIPNPSWSWTKSEKNQYDLNVLIFIEKELKILDCVFNISSKINNSELNTVNKHWKFDFFPSRAKDLLGYFFMVSFDMGDLPLFHGIAILIQGQLRFRPYHLQLEIDLHACILSYTILS